MMFYLCSINGIASYLKRRLEVNGFSCYQRYSCSMNPDVELGKQLSKQQSRQIQESEAIYLYFRHLETENEFWSIRVSNHSCGDDPTMIANHEVFACIKREGATSYIMLLKCLAEMYDFQLNQVELKLLAISNYRLYTAQLQKLTSDYYLHLPTKNSFCMPERIVID